MKVDGGSDILLGLVSVQTVAKVINITTCGERDTKSLYIRVNGCIVNPTPKFAEFSKTCGSHKDIVKVTFSFS